MLNTAAKQIRDAQLDPEKNVRKIAECLLLIFDIRMDIFKKKPELAPDYVKDLLSE